MTIWRDFVKTLYDLFTLNNRSFTETKKNDVSFTPNLQSKLPLHIRNHIKNSKSQLSRMNKMIDSLPKDQQYLLRKISSYCNQIIELVIICPKSYEHLRPFYNGYFQSIFDIVQEFTYLSNQQGTSIELNRKIDICMQQLQDTKHHLEELFQQGLILETEDLYQRIHQLNYLMKEDLNKNGSVYLLDEKRLQYQQIIK